MEQQLWELLREFLLAFEELPAQQFSQLLVRHSSEPLGQRTNGHVKEPQRMNLGASQLRYYFALSLVLVDCYKIDCHLQKRSLPTSVYLQ